MSEKPAAFVFVLLGVTLAGCGGAAVETVETTAAVPVTVEVARVETLHGTVNVTGVVVPAPGGDLTVSAPGPARIAELSKAEGDPVREGDVLVRFDMPALAADLAARRAEVAQATARLDTARAAVVRLSSLVERGVAAQREVDEAKRDQAEVEAALLQAQSGATAALALAERAVVRATFTGVVAARWHSQGDFVESANDPVLRVIDARALQVKAAVPVAELSRVAVGRTGRVTGPGGGAGEPVRVIARPAQVDAGRTTADVRLAFVSPTHLPAGAAVDVEIIAEARPKVVVVPAAAIVREGDEAFVMIAGADDKAKRRPVKLGLAAGGLVEVTSGVAAGDRVIVRGQDGLPDGAHVTVAK